MKETIQQKVGKRILEIRTEKNISQRELALKCSFEKSNMSRLEKGNSNATLSTLEKVCDALQVDYIELFKF
ncbi:helix-turn-helix domain-containing protein [Flavobacterium hungaricum]|uniref:XRE family transcriptional regulator n=1 Tax=Flavobacterium hungaricum TaxID=2082725 RepID=A0ABR9TDE3_9FLAO|nr:helix-turn-helix transcriptional regulator [Flavobacterium hungaricum]MBE8723375.1 XRE family transcriptional regulator [Flavobacterium hungaricum]